MNIEKLHKLNELKTSGIITEEEFNAQKDMILNAKENSETNQSQIGFSFKNLLISLGAVIGIFLLIVLLTSPFVDENGDNESLGSFLAFIFLIFPFVLMFIAIKFKTNQYKSTCAYWLIIVGSFLLGPIVYWIVIYEILQVKDGRKELK